MALENGWVDADRNAFVSLRLAKGEPIECLIDTGFNRELFLPLDLAESLELRFTGEQEFIVAGGARLTGFTSLVDIEWLGTRRLAEAILHEGNDLLIGTALLQGTRLNIDYIYNTVQIEKP